MPKKILKSNKQKQQIVEKQIVEKPIIQKAFINKTNNIELKMNELYKCGVQFENKEILENVSKDLKLINFEENNIGETINLLKIILEQILNIVSIFNK